MAEPISAHAAVRHILESPAIAARTRPYIGRDAVDWAGVVAEAETMTAGERLLVSVAHDLWHAEGVVAVSELPRRLGETGFRRVLTALELFRGEPVGLRAGGDPLSRAA